MPYLCTFVSNVKYVIDTIYITFDTALQRLSKEESRLAKLNQEPCAHLVMIATDKNFHLACM